MSELSWFVASVVVLLVIVVGLLVGVCLGVHLHWKRRRVEDAEGWRR